MDDVAAASLVGVDAETGDVYVLEHPRVDPRGVIIEDGSFGLRHVLRGLSRSGGAPLLRVLGPIYQDVHHYTPPCLARSDPHGSPLPQNLGDHAGCFHGSVLRDTLLFFSVLRTLADPVGAGRALGVAATPSGDSVALVRVRRAMPAAGLAITQIRQAAGPHPDVRRIHVAGHDIAMGAYGPPALSPSGNRLALFSLTSGVLLVDLRDGATDVRRVAVPEGLWEPLLWGDEDTLFAGITRVIANRFCLWQVDVPNARASELWCEPMDATRPPILARLGSHTGLFWSGTGSRAWRFELGLPGVQGEVERRAFMLPIGSKIIAVDPVGGWIVCEGDEVPERQGVVTLVGSTTLRLDTGVGAPLHAARVMLRDRTLLLTFIRDLGSEQQLMAVEVQVP